MYDKGKVILVNDVYMFFVINVHDGLIFLTLKCDHYLHSMYWSRRCHSFARSHVRYTIGLRGTDLAACSFKYGFHGSLLTPIQLHHQLVALQDVLLRIRIRDDTYPVNTRTVLNDLLVLLRNHVEFFLRG